MITFGMTKELNDYLYYSSTYVSAMEDYSNAKVLYDNAQAVNESIKKEAAIAINTAEETLKSANAVYAEASTTLTEKENSSIAQKKTGEENVNKAYATKKAKVDNASVVTSDYDRAVSSHSVLVSNYNTAVKKLDDYEVETKKIKANHVSYEALYDEKRKATKDAKEELDRISSYIEHVSRTPSKLNEQKAAQAKYDRCREEEDKVRVERNHASTLCAVRDASYTLDKDTLNEEKNAASRAVKRSEEKIKAQQKQKEDADKEKIAAIKAYDDCVSTTQYDASTAQAIYDYYKTRSGLASESVETANNNKYNTVKLCNEKTTAANVVVTNAKTNVETKKTNYETSKKDKDSKYIFCICKGNI